MRTFLAVLVIVFVVAQVIYRVEKSSEPDRPGYPTATLHDPTLTTDMFGNPRTFPEGVTPEDVCVQDPTLC
jgi:hypothetical protein